MKLESVDPIRDIGEAVTLCHELLRSGVKESLLIIPVKTLVEAISMTYVPLAQPPPDEAIEYLREARIRLPDLEEVCFALFDYLFARFNWARTHDDYEEAMSILDEVIADQNGNVERAMGLAQSLARVRFAYTLKPEHLAEAIFRTRTHLNAMSSEDPDRPSQVKRLADLEKRRFKAFGVISGQEDNAEVVDDSHLAASPQMSKSDFVEFPLPMPDRRDPMRHLKTLSSILVITDLPNIKRAIEYCRHCLTSPHLFLPLTLDSLGRLLYRLFSLTGNIDHQLL